MDPAIAMEPPPGQLNVELNDAVQIPPGAQGKPVISGAVSLRIRFADELAADTPKPPAVDCPIPLDTALAIACAWAWVRFFGVELAPPHAIITAAIAIVISRDTARKSGEFLCMGLLQVLICRGRIKVTPQEAG